MDPMIPFHVTAGSVALLAGAAALVLRKGGPRHALAGTAFFVAMLLMAGSGAVIAALRPERGTAVIGLLTCYLVASSWTTARRRSGEAGLVEWLWLAVAVGCAVAMLSFGIVGVGSPTGRMDSLPAVVHFPFAFLAALAAALDLNFLLRGRLTGRQRVARHLWRMCVALFIAAFSFFLGQQDEFPEAWQGSFIWFVPGLATLAAMIFWLVRVRFSRAYLWVRPKSVDLPRRAGPAPASLQASSV
ncbi:MAG: hypothetical protein ACXWUP_10675 [Allosphingosinicella sp.]